MKVRELLCDESKWTQYANARDGYGLQTSADSPDAVCWCLSGAIDKCYGDCYGNNHRIWILVLDNLPSAYGIGYWNDTHSYEDVKKLVDELDI
jgi:hypothetical protein